MLERRELASRKIKVFHFLAKALVKMGFTPNMISMISVAFAALAGYSLIQLREADGSQFYLFWFLSLAGILLRLLCNLLDGLMAIEGGLKTVTGDIYNDFPDRISDVLILLGAGMAIPYEWGKDLGWLTALLAVLTAYIRLLGTSLQGGQDYKGPLAKQHRMGLLNLILVALLFEHLMSHTSWSLVVGVPLIAVGSLATVVARLQRLVNKLKAR